MRKTDQGAIASKTQLDKIKFYVDLAQKEGGKDRAWRFGAEVDQRIAVSPVYFFQPTVITDLPVSCRVNREEIFGPVITITPFDHEEEVIATPNDTEYGPGLERLDAEPESRPTASRKNFHRPVWVNCWLVRDLRVRSAA